MYVGNVRTVLYVALDRAVSLWERYGTHHIILDHRVLPLRLATYYMYTVSQLH